MAAKPFEPDPLSEVQLDKDARLVINADGELVLAPSMRPGPADDLALDDAPDDAGGLLADEGELGPMEAGLVIAPAPSNPAPNPATADLLPPAPPSAAGGPRQGGSLAAPTSGASGAPPGSASPGAAEARHPDRAPAAPQPASAAPSSAGSKADAAPASPFGAPASPQRQGGSLAVPANAPRQRGPDGAPPGVPGVRPPGGALDTPARAPRADFQPGARGGTSSNDPGTAGSDDHLPPASKARAPFADLVAPKSAWDDLADTVRRESGPPPPAPADDSAWADLAEPPAPSDAAPLPDSAFLDPPSAGLPPPGGLASLSESAVVDPPAPQNGPPPPSAAGGLASLSESAVVDPPAPQNGPPPPSAADDLAALPEPAFVDPPAARSGLPPPSDLAPPSRLPSAVTDDLLPPPAPPDDEADEELLLTEDDVVFSQSTPAPDDAPFAALLEGARGKLPPFPPPAGTSGHGTAMPDLPRSEEPKVEYPTVQPRAEEWTDAEDETPAVQTPDLRRSAVTLAPNLTHSPSKVEATISPLGGAPAAPAPNRPTTRRPASFAGRKIRETSRAPKSRPASNASNPRAEPYFTRGLAALEAGDLASAERDLAIAMTYAPSVERYRAAFAELKRRKGR